MAKLSAHGTELLRVEHLNCRVAYMSDGKMLRDSGDGWKLWKKLKPGVDAREHAAKWRAFYENVTPDRFHRAELRKRWVAEWPGLEHRVRAYITFDMLGDDIDGIWSELDDAGIGTDLETIRELLQYWRAALQEGNEAAARKSPQPLPHLARAMSDAMFAALLADLNPQPSTLHSQLARSAFTAYCAAHPHHPNVRAAWAAFRTELDTELQQPVQTPAPPLPVSRP